MTDLGSLQFKGKSVGDLVGVPSFSGELTSLESLWWVQRVEPDSQRLQPFSDKLNDFVAEWTEREKRHRKEVQDLQQRHQREIEEQKKSYLKNNSH